MYTNACICIFHDGETRRENKIKKRKKKANETGLYLSTLTTTYHASTSQTCIQEDKIESKLQLIHPLHLIR